MFPTSSYICLFCFIRTYVNVIRIVFMKYFTACLLQIFNSHLFMNIFHLTGDWYAVFVNGCLGTFENFGKATLASSCLSVRPSVRSRATTRLPLNGFSLNLTFQQLLKICRENSRFYYNLTKMTGTLHEDHCTIRMRYLAHFFLELEIFQTKVVETL
jgi:hypothetical protein